MTLRSQRLCPSSTSLPLAKTPPNKNDGRAVEHRWHIYQPIVRLRCSRNGFNTPYPSVTFGYTSLTDGYTTSDGHAVKKNQNITQKESPGGRRCNGKPHGRSPDGPSAYAVVAFKQPLVGLYAHIRPKSEYESDDHHNRARHTAVNGTYDTGYS